MKKSYLQYKISLILLLFILIIIYPSVLEIVKSKIEDIISLLENTGYFLINEQEKHEYKTFTKDDKSLLTELDVASEILIKNELTSLFGNIKVLSEENSQEENEQIAKEKFCFLLDPIDGTKNFDKGKDFTINLQNIYNENHYNFQLKENTIKNIIGRWKSNSLRFTKYNAIENRYNKNKELILWEYNNTTIFTTVVSTPKTL